MCISWEFNPHTVVVESSANLSKFTLYLRSSYWLNQHPVNHVRQPNSLSSGSYTECLPLAFKTSKTYSAKYIHCSPPQYGRCLLPFDFSISAVPKPMHKHDWNCSKSSIRAAFRCFSSIHHVLQIQPAAQRLASYCISFGRPPTKLQCTFHHKQIMLARLQLQA